MRLAILALCALTALANDRNGRDYQKSGPGFCSVMNGIVYECDGTTRKLTEEERRLMDQDRQNNNWDNNSGNNAGRKGTVGQNNNWGSGGRDAPSIGSNNEGNSNAKKGRKGTVGQNNERGNSRNGRKGVIGQNNSWDSAGNGFPVRWDQLNNDFERRFKEREVGFSIVVWFFWWSENFYVLQTRVYFFDLSSFEVVCRNFGW
jgi:hypothetical protein